MNPHGTPGDFSKECAHLTQDELQAFMALSDADKTLVCHLIQNLLKCQEAPKRVRHATAETRQS